MTPPSLVIFDADGTLVDSQDVIVGAMTDAFGLASKPVPERAEILGIVGLSLPEAMAELAPDLSREAQLQLAEFYKQGFVERRRSGREAALYPGARDALARIDGAGHLMSIATGKARRGLDHMLDVHDLRHLFIATQTADDAPSKPAPGMVLNCLGGTGADPRRTAVVGDTEFDMAMARAAGVRAIGVTWGYHAPERLTRGGAEVIVETFEALDSALIELEIVP